MNRSRVTGDLASHGNIFVDIANDRVGIGSTIPAHKLSLPDDEKISLGDSANLQIYYDASSYITNSTAGHLFIKTINGGSDINLQSADDFFVTTGTKNSIIARDSAQVELYHNASKKLETTAYGIDVTGTTDTDGLAVSGVSTFTGVIDANAGADISGGVSIGGELNLIGSSDAAKYIDARVGTSNNLNFRSTSGGDSNHVTMMSLNTSGALSLIHN